MENLKGGEAVRAYGGNVHAARNVGCTEKRHQWRRICRVKNLSVRVADDQIRSDPICAGSILLEREEPVDSV